MLLMYQILKYLPSVSVQRPKALHLLYIDQRFELTCTFRYCSLLVNRRQYKETTLYIPVVPHRHEEHGTVVRVKSP
jgi:hypothetical protein